MNAFAAKYPGFCGECGLQFGAGEMIRYDENDELVHAYPEGCHFVNIEQVAGEPCKRCFCVHTGEC